MTPVRQLSELTKADCLRLAGSVPFGRIVFTIGALPAVRVVNHLVVGEQIVIRASIGAAITAEVDGTGTVVAYEADLIDPAERLGWSVVVVGRAHRVTDTALAARYQESLSPWVGGEMDQVIAIAADLVTGYRMIPGPAAEPPVSAPRIPAV